MPKLPVKSTRMADASLEVSQNPTSNILQSKESQSWIGRSSEIFPSVSILVRYPTLEAGVCVRGIS